MIYTRKPFPPPDLPHIVHIGLCSVVPELLPAWEQMAAKRGCPLTLLTGQSATPLRNAYQTPDTLGGDRLLAAVAAAQRVGTPVIPLHAGTTTVAGCRLRGRRLSGWDDQPGYRQCRTRTHRRNQHPPPGSVA